MPLKNVQGSAAQVRKQSDGRTVVEAILLPWFAFQNQSSLAAEALVDTIVTLYRRGWSVEQVQLELSLLTLQDQSEGMQQMQALDKDLLISFVVLIWLTCKVRKSRSR